MIRVIVNPHAPPHADMVLICSKEQYEQMKLSIPAAAPMDFNVLFPTPGHGPSALERLGGIELPIFSEFHPQPRASAEELADFVEAFERLTKKPTDE